jgi:hypothetical protein
VSLGQAVLNPSLTALEASGSLPPISVADTRAANPGWTLSAASSNFVDTYDGRTVLSGRYLGLAPSLSAHSSSQLITLGGAVPAGAGFVAGTPVGSAGVGAGLGTAVFGGRLDLRAPTSVPAGFSLKSVIEITLL